MRYLRGNDDLDLSRSLGRRSLRRRGEAIIHLRRISPPVASIESGLELCGSLSLLGPRHDAGAHLFPFALVAAFSSCFCVLTIFPPFWQRSKNQGIPIMHLTWKENKMKSSRKRNKRVGAVGFHSSRSAECFTSLPLGQRLTCLIKRQCCAYGRRMYVLPTH